MLGKQFEKNLKKEERKIQSKLVKRKKQDTRKLILACGGLKKKKKRSVQKCQIARRFVHIFGTCFYHAVEGKCIEIICDLLLFNWRH